METVTPELALVDAEPVAVARALRHPAHVGNVAYSAISPELVLVDPELAAEARRRLPLGAASARETSGGAPVATRRPVAQHDPAPDRPEEDPVADVPSLPAPRPSATRPQTPEAASVQPRKRSTRALRRAPVRLALLSSVMGLAVLFGPLVVSAVSRTVSSGSAGAAAPPPVSAPSTRGYDIRWRPVPGATNYNVVLQVQGVRALDLWPLEAHVYIPSGSLPPGRYSWFAYPAVRAGGRPSFGLLAGHGVLTVPVTNPPVAPGA